MLNKTSLELRIFDFDQTISKNHTFKENQIKKLDIISQIFEKKQDINENNNKVIEEFRSKAYQKGYEDSKNNIKNGIENYFKYEGHVITTIATYHNNSDYIAGYVGRLLKSQLTFCKTVESNALNDSKIAINYYQIGDKNQYFLICYLPAIGKKFQELMNYLKDKNKQISFLYDTLYCENRIDKQTSIHFYDDSAPNVNGVVNLDYNISGYLIKGSIDYFKIINTYHSKHYESFNRTLDLEQSRILSWDCKSNTNIENNELNQEYNQLDVSDNLLKSVNNNNNNHKRKAELNYNSSLSFFTHSENYEAVDKSEDLFFSSAQDEKSKKSKFSEKLNISNLDLPNNNNNNNNNNNDKDNNIDKSYLDLTNFFN